MVPAPTDTSTSGQSTFSLIRAWLDDCLEYHITCDEKYSRANGFLPTRILRLNDTPTGMTWQLVQGVDCPAGTKYCTLSHCWGSKSAELTLRLLSSTYEDLCKPQSTDALPPTFREAAEATYRLGLNHLWIDRLCIYQDSTEDWTRQAGDMYSVYSGSFINISALGARNDQDGCFFNRDPQKVMPSQVLITVSRDPKPRTFICTSEEETAGFLDQPLLERGWVLQERILAPRVLHFGQFQVFWECHQRRSHEAIPGLTGAGWSKEKSRDWNYWKGLLASAGRYGCNDDEYENLFRCWYDIANTYSSCKFTIETDRLIALSGLADDMQKRLRELKEGPHHYRAGLWEERIHRELIWFFAHHAQRSVQYCAPSWSWACLKPQQQRDLHQGWMLIPFDNAPCAEVLSISTLR